MAEKQITSPRDFPSVEELLQVPELTAQTKLPRPMVAQVIREAMAAAKEDVKSGKALSIQQFHGAILCEIRGMERMMITRVVNATGVVVHTNLGRAPLSTELIEQVRRAITGYSNVEFDLVTGQRGSRGEACEKFLSMLSEAEAATVVNNCAAALFVSLSALAKGKQVIISRGELVQIGGGFRIPDILRQSGAKLREVGTSNITTIDDYRNAINDKAALILKVHKSNFVQAGFTEEVPLKDLVALGNERNVPVLNDLGSGVFISTRPVLGYAEPTVQQSVRAGADITCFSGDKLLGGMQAGLIVGKTEFVKKIKRHPLFRTVRVDKVVFAVLENLLASYLNGTEVKDIPLWSMMAVPFEELEERALAIVKLLGSPSTIEVVPLSGYVGGGAAPEVPIPSCGLRIVSPHKADSLLKKMRHQSLPIIGRIEDDRLVLDLRAVDPGDDAVIVDALKRILAT